MVTPEFRKDHDPLHQCVRTILCVARVSAMYETPCLCSVGLFNRSDKDSDTSFRDQSQRVLHLYAALQMCFSHRFHSCQGDRISFGFALVHQHVRKRADEAHVALEAEAQFLIICVVSIERQGLAQASQVLELCGIKSSAIVQQLKILRGSAASKNRLRDHA